jgi:hypothetical protein
MANNIRILVRQKLSTDYYVDGYLDLDDDTTINTVIQLVDVREPDKKATDYIQTFTLPGSKRNNQTFQHIFENGFEGYAYDPTRKIDCQVEVNDKQYFTGYLQVNRITRSGMKITSYEVTVYSKLGSFWADISDFDLRDIVDMSEFDHPITNRVVAQSWGPLDPNDKLSAPYQYPLFASPIVKYGLHRPGIYVNRQLTDFQLGYGYVYPTFWTGQTTQTDWKTSDFKPSFYVKTLFDKILKSQNVKYNSTFLNSEYFRRLIIPGFSQIDSNDSSVQLTDQQIKERTCWVRFDNTSNRYQIALLPTETGKSYGPYTIKFNNKTTIPSTDVSSYYNPSTGRFQILKGGKYNFNVNLILELRFTGNGWNNGTDIVGLAFQAGRNIPIKVEIVSSGGKVWASDQYEFLIPEEYYGGSPLPGNFYIRKEVATSIKAQYIGAGETFFVRVSLSTTGSKYKYKTYDPASFGSPERNCEMFLSVIPYESVGVFTSAPPNSVYNPYEGSFALISLADTSVADGDWLQMNNFIPDMKAIDLIKNLNKMFNLYWLLTEDGTFIIEPRDKFYESGGQLVVKDWTYKVDRDADMIIEPLYDLSSKYYNFQYDTDDTFENIDYDNEFKSTIEDHYGSKKVEVNSDFVVETTDIDLDFAASPIVNLLDGEKYMASFTKIDKDKRVYQKPGIRILFYGGLLPCSTWYIKNIYQQSTSTSKGLQLTHYPYAGHLDNPLNPKWDLNWGICKKYYFKWNNLTLNTLFNQFYSDYLDEITDKNSHLLTCNVVLSENDMINLDVRDIIQVDEVWYRINKVTHNPLNNTGIVELFRLKKTQSFKGQTNNIFDINGGKIADPNFPGTLPTPNPIPVIPPSPKPWINPPTPVFPTPGGWVIPNWTPDSWISVDEEIPVRRPWRTGTGYPSTFPVVSSSGGTTIYSPRPANTKWADVIPANNWTGLKNDISSLNVYPLHSDVSVFGTNNYVAPRANAVRVSGNNNRVYNSTNVQINGNNNTVAGGLTNVNIIGDNALVNESNVSYINGIKSIQPANSVDPLIYRGGVNTTLHKQPVVSGGKNSVDACIKIQGGQDTSNWDRFKPGISLE